MYNARMDTQQRPPSLLNLDIQLCFALYSAMLGMNKVYRKQLKALGLTYPQYLVMLVLWQQDQLIVTDICQRLYLDTATLTPLLKRMEAQGLVLRQRSEQDERRVVVSLTEAGRALREPAEAVPHCVMQATQCSVDELVGLREQLVQLRERLFASR